MVIDLTDLFTEMRRRRGWAADRVVHNIDPSGEHLRMDQWDRLMRFDDFGQSGIFGWLLDGQLAVNHRSLAGLQPEDPSALSI
ncbi:MAG: hypothetical protein M3Q07_27710 [Pseudobdellovibrionaceae bacterium]|nr:hypothetical protein [Pseudobdellovibrionaceae bacterium]